MMDDFVSESESDYTSYWRDWVRIFVLPLFLFEFLGRKEPSTPNCGLCSQCSRGLLAQHGQWTIRLPRQDRLAVVHNNTSFGTTLGSILTDIMPLPRKRWGLLRGRPRKRRRLTHGRPKISQLINFVILQFISSRGNEYFCEIDEEYLTDRFNLTGLNTEVQYYQYALDLITDVFDVDCDDDMRESIEKAARHLYGLVHARYIVTTRGLAKMVRLSATSVSAWPVVFDKYEGADRLRKQLDKYKKADFGKCPRVNCASHPLLPMGLSDVPNLKPVKLWCARCEDMYNPKSSRHATIDGAYFGTSFHNILFQVYPSLVPTKSTERYVPKVYGFKVHAPAALIRWQEDKRDEMRRRLKRMEIEPGFKDDGDIEDEEEEEEDEDEEEAEFYQPGAAAEVPLTAPGGPDVMA